MCVAAAGPVKDGMANLTNLAWSIGPDVEIAEKTIVVNDLMAAGIGIRALPREALDLVIGSEFRNFSRSDSALVVGVGNGFNSAHIIGLQDNFTRVFAAESGHRSLPSNCNILCQKLDMHGNISVEDILSGRGLVGLYRQLASNPLADIASSSILDRAASKSDKVAVEAVTTFSKVLAKVLQDLTLCHLPTAGIFLAGGLANAVRPFLGDDFKAEFLEHSKMAGPVSSISIHLVTSDELGLIGAGECLKLGASDARF